MTKTSKEHIAHLRLKGEEMNVPDHTLDGLLVYLEHGVCGDFLDAVLSSDLFEAFGRADYINLDNMKQIIEFIYNEMPATSWGTREKVATWKAEKLADRTKETIV